MLPLDANQTTLVLDARVFYRLRNKVTTYSRVNPLPQVATMFGSVVILWERVYPRRGLGLIGL